VTIIRRREAKGEKKKEFEKRAKCRWQRAAFTISPYEGTASKRAAYLKVVLVCWRVKREKGPQT